LVRVRGRQDVDDELRQIEAALAGPEQRGRLSDLLSPAVRPALIVGIGLAIFQQVTGINTVIYFAPTIIRTAGASSIQVSILATAGIGVVNVLMTIVSMWLIDRVGRRPLLLIGITGMAISLGVLGFLFRRSAASGGLAKLAVVTLMRRSRVASLSGEDASVEVTEPSGCRNSAGQMRQAARRFIDQ
jgi:SP family galactose:H+ symporter-like MFS transporter